jgi:hypothetical protein
MLYGDPALRQSNDIDLLVSKSDFQAAGECLLSLGYRPFYPLTERQRKAYLKSSNHEGFVTERDGIRVSTELHYDLLPPFSPFHVQMECPLRRLQWLTVGGMEVPVLQPEDLLVYLCIHGTKHFWLRLQWLCDIVQLLRRSREIDLNRVIRQLEHSDVRRMVLLGLFLSGDILGTSLPEYIVKMAIQDMPLLKLARRIKKRIFSNPPHVSTTIEKLIDRSLLKGQNGFDRYLHLACQFFRTLFTLKISDFQSFFLPDSLFPLYYILRPLRLTVIYGKMSIGKLSGFFHEDT